MITYFIEYNRYLNVLGIVLILGLSYVLSRQRSKISLKLVGNSFLMLLALAFASLRTGVGQAVLSWAAGLISKLYLYAEEGTKFVFGPLASIQEPWGFVFAFRVLPILVFFGALMALLFHYKIIQRAAYPLTLVLHKILGTSAAETLNSVANIFLGQTEAPLLIKNYISRLTRSELLTVMVVGMATISAPLLAVYGAMGVPVQYLLASSVMAIPAAVLIAKLLIPETEQTVTKTGLHEVSTDDKQNVFGAIATGTFDGMNLAMAIGAIIISFVALIALVNGLLGFGCTSIETIAAWFGLTVHVPCVTLQYIFGWVFAPVGWLMGLTGDEIFKAGELIGIRVCINELIAFSQMVTLNLSERALALLTFALCGFGNFSSIGIQIAGLGALAPDRRKDVAQLGLCAVLASVLANLMCAFIAGLML